MNITTTQYDQATRIAQLENLCREMAEALQAVSNHGICDAFVGQMTTEKSLWKVCAASRN